MFNTEEKKKIAAAVEKVLLGLKHPEMPKSSPRFILHVYGKEGWSWADIQPNWEIRQEEKETQYNPEEWDTPGPGGDE